MKDRQPINSEVLQKRFPKVYRRFFSKCSLVVSAARPFFWSGEYAVMYGGIAILQNAPLRTYIGLEQIEKLGVEGGTLINYSGEDDQFSNYNFNEIYQSDLISILSEYLHGYVQNGVRVHILSEIPTNHGFGTRGSVVTGLIVALQLYLGKITMTDVESWATMPVKDLAHNKQFDETFRFCWETEVAHSLYNSSGAHSFPTIAGAQLPLIYLKFPHNLKINPDPITGYHLDYPKYFDYSGFRITDVTEERALIWPVDFGIIFTGIQMRSGSVIKSVSKVRDYVNNFVGKFAKKAILDHSEVNLKFFQSMCNGDLFHKYINVLCVASGETLSSLIEFFKVGSSKENLDHFFRAINLYQRMLYALGVITPELDNVIKLLSVEFRKAGIPDFAIKISGAGGGGSVVFVGPMGVFRDKIMTIIEEVKKQTGLDLSLDYASWIDGLEKEGIRVEQYLRRAVYSSFISENSVVVQRWKNKGIIQAELHSMEIFEKEMKNINILLNKIDNKIYICGKKLDSKTLPSSSTTIEILSILLKNIGKYVPSEKLPRSSYSQDRNEFASKIIRPLNNIYQKCHHQKLPIKITGSLTNFYIKLGPGTEIVVVSKIL